LHLLEYRTELSDRNVFGALYDPTVREVDRKVTALLDGGDRRLRSAERRDDHDSRGVSIRERHTSAVWRPRGRVTRERALIIAFAREVLREPRGRAALGTGQPEVH